MWCKGEGWDVHRTFPQRPLPFSTTKGRKPQIQVKPRGGWPISPASRDGRDSWWHARVLWWSSSLTRWLGWGGKVQGCFIMLTWNWLYVVIFVGFIVILLGVLSQEGKVSQANLVPYFFPIYYSLNILQAVKRLGQLILKVLCKRHIWCVLEVSRMTVHNFSGLCGFWV